MECHHIARTQLIQFHLMIFGISEWVFQYRNTWNEVELQPIEMLKTEPIKKNLKYKHGILEL